MARDRQIAGLADLYDPVQSVTIDTGLSGPITVTRRTWIPLASFALAAQDSRPSEEALAVYRDNLVLDGLANAGTFNILWPPVGPLSAKQLAHIAASGITAINHSHEHVR